MNAPLQSTRQASQTVGIKILAFGPPGAGKTRLCATMPNPVILSAEGGLLSLADSNLPFWEIKTVTDFENAWKWASTSAEARKFASICIDSISEIAENELTFAKTGTKDGRQAYGRAQEEVVKIVKNFRKLSGPHVYFSAKQATVKTETGIIAGIMMPGNNLANQIPFEFDEVFQLIPGKTPEGVRFSSLRCHGAGEWDIVKDRSGALNEWEPNDLGAILNKIAAKRK